MDGRDGSSHDELLNETALVEWKVRPLDWSYTIGLPAEIREMICAIFRFARYAAATNMMAAFCVRAISLLTTGHLCLAPFGREKECSVVDMTKG